MGWLLLLAVVLALLQFLGVTHGTTAQPNQAQIPQLSTASPIPNLSGGIIGGNRIVISDFREWRRADPTLINSLWRSKMGNGIRKQLENVSLETRITMWFQQDEGPDHYSTNVRDHLDKTFPNRWIIHP
ncbi:hypothetical protein HUJ04_007141 [Dendroctonus ponderosae]|nr:hypothetical protein HUJ04_007141 [Dendroctonus ponderosae]KAH1025090.1 hypothetical protein HUJ05_009887 [Dendroctonus ponderosae]